MVLLAHFISGLVVKKVIFCGSLELIKRVEEMWLLSHVAVQFFCTVIITFLWKSSYFSFEVKDQMLFLLERCCGLKTPTAVDID